jgi:NTP pyrophosphatase (non-canonical NTP hydrolase)
MSYRDNLELELAAQMNRQDRKWGIQHHTQETWLSILGEEFGEACKALNEGDLSDYRNELLHVAAVAMAAIEDEDSDHGERSYDEANRMWVRSGG